MTKDRKAKRVARAYSKANGVSYTAARRATSGGASGPAGPTGPGGPAGPSGWSGEDADDFEPKSLTELLRPFPQGEFDRLVGESIRTRGDVSTSGVSVDFDPPVGVSEPSVHQFVMEESSVEAQIDEEYEGGTLACNVTASGTLTVEGLMAKADAIASQAAGQVSIYEEEFNDHYSSVIFDVEVEATFLAIVNPEYEGVEDFSFEGAVVISP